MRTIVIGGGIAGLACTYRLREMGIPALLLEQADRVGGVIESAQQDGFLFELGPQSFLSTEPLLEMIAGLGLGDELLRADPRAPRYVLADGRLRRVPMSPPALLTTSLLSAGSKWRLVSEPFRRTQPPEGDESVAAFVRRKFGNELLELLVGPFVSGVYAGDPEKLSLRSAFPAVHEWENDYGSVLRGAMKSRPAKKKKPRSDLCSFRSGIATLVRVLGEKLGDAVRCGVRAESISRGKADGKSRFDLQVTHHGRLEILTASTLILATPAHATGRLLANLSGAFPERFAQISYAPVAVVAAGYRREQIGHPLEGFGFLVPRKERLRILGTVWNSSLFQGRAPEGMVTLTSFAGGATEPEVCSWSEERIAETVDREVASVLKISGAPVTRIVQRHTHALPQYNLGHGKITTALLEMCAAMPGLFLAGNYFEGPSIGACVEQAFRVAEAVRHYLALQDETGTPQKFQRSSALDSR